MESEKLYQIYLSLGPNRTIARVSELTGKPLDSLYRVSAKHRWKTRVLEDTYASNTLEEGSSPESVLSVIAGDSLAKLRETIRNLRPTTARDAKALLEIYLLLQGRATVITQEQGDSEGALEFVLSLLTPEQLAQVGEALGDPREAHKATA